MPVINPDQCYKVLPLPSVSPTSVTPLTIDELTDEIAATLAALSDKTKEWITTELSKFIGPDGTYTYKDKLIEGIQLINTHLKKSEVADSEKRVVADKLLEGMEMCASGCHDRINIILLGLNRPEHIDDLLERIRVGVVDSVARASTDEVHLHNSFFIAAATLGYGVRPLNSTDVYSREFTATEAESFKKAFDKKYHAVSILNDLQIAIESELRTYFGYQGKKTEEDPYSIGPLDRMTGFLNKILGTNFTIDDFFIKEYSEKDGWDLPTDINWDVIQDYLWKKLRDEHYITFSAEEERLLSALYALTPGTEAPAAGAGATCTPPTILTLLSDKAYQSLLYSLEIDKYPQLLKSLAQREAVAHALVETNHGATTKDILHYFKLTSAFFVNDAELRERHLFSLITPAWMKKEENIEAIFDLPLDNNVNQDLFLIACRQLQEDILVALFALPENKEKLKNMVFLIIEKEKNLEKLEAVINLIKKLPINLQIEIFTATDIIFLSICHNLAAIPLLYSWIKTFPLPNQKEILATRKLIKAVPIRAAIANNGAALPIILESIKTLDHDVQKAIMTERCSRGINLFIDEISPHLLEGIKTFHTDIQNEILTAKNIEGYNALMIAIERKALEVSALIEFIKTLASNVQKEIMTTTNVVGINALILSIDHPNASVLLPALFEIIKGLDADTQREILAANTPNGPSIFKIVDEHLELFPTFLEGIKVLHPDAQKEFLTAKDKNGFTIFMRAVHHFPATLPALFQIIKGLDADTQREILAAKDAVGYNILRRAMDLKPDVLPMLFEGIKALHPDAQIAFMTAKGPDNYDVLKRAIQWKPELLPTLLEGIKTLHLSTQKAVMTAEGDKGYNAIRWVVYYKRDLIPMFLQGIKAFHPDVQKAAMLSKWEDYLGDGPSILMFTKVYSGDALAAFLREINNLHPDVQKQILKAPLRPGISVITVILEQLPDIVLPMIKTYHWSIQLDVLQEPAKSIDTVKAYRETLIKAQLNDVATRTPLEQVIYNQLKLMQFNAIDKQAAVLLALHAIKVSNPDNVDAAIKAELLNSKSELYRALDMRRYTFFPPLASKTTGSYNKILATAEKITSSTKLSV